MSGNSIIGKRVRLSPAGERADIIRRGKKTGIVTAVQSNAVVYWWVIRDGVLHAQPYLSEFWQIDTEQPE